MAEYRGPRIGDRVSVQLAGHVVALQGRDGVPGADVQLDGGSVVWVPLDAVTLVERVQDAAP